MHKIDLVYLWVDGADTAWRKEKNKWLQITQGTTTIAKNAHSDERYRDNGELKYSLRSVAQNAPWVNHIYIITGFGQVPKWLNTKHPKITIIPHSDIIPKDALPTFNSNTIELCLHNIPGLSEHFLLMNDDLFFNRTLQPSFFFDKTGSPRILHGIRHGNKHKLCCLDNADTYLSSVILSAKLIQEIYGHDMYKLMPSHGIDPYLKSAWIACRNHPQIKPHIDNQLPNKFRTKTELQRWLFNLYNIVNGYATPHRSYPHKSGHHLIADTIYNILHFRATRRSPYVCSCVQGHEKSLRTCAIFCINDSDNNTPDMLRANIQYLDSRWPDKSPYEK